MKFKLKAAFAVVLAAVMALAAVPVSAMPRFESETPKAEIEPYWTVPDGYNAHDYNKCVQFLEQTDENGVKNGEKLSASYDPNDPGTWWEDWVTPSPCFEWKAVNGEQRVNWIDVSYFDLFGSLDLSGCIALENLYCYNNNLTELDLSGCTALEHLSCAHNSLTELSVTSCTSLEGLSCSENNLTQLDVTRNIALVELVCTSNNLSELDVSQNTELDILFCSENNLTGLDITQNTALEYLYCDHNNLNELNVTYNTGLRNLSCNSNSLAELDVTQNLELRVLSCIGNCLDELDLSQNTMLRKLHSSGNCLSELDISNNPWLSYDYILADGCGFVGYDYYYEYYEEHGGWFAQGKVFAYPVNGAIFEGFYYENDVLVSAGEWDDSVAAFTYEFESSTIPTGTIIARFSGGALPGDLDGNGSVSVADAISTLRLSMGISDGSGMNTDAADMDGNGSITLADAIVILRMAMGLA